MSTHFRLICEACGESTDLGRSALPMSWEKVELLDFLKEHWGHELSAESEYGDPLEEGSRYFVNLAGELPWLAERLAKEKRNKDQGET